MGNTCHIARTGSSSRAPIFLETRGRGRATAAVRTALKLVYVAYMYTILVGRKTWKENRQASACRAIAARARQRTKLTDQHLPTLMHRPTAISGSHGCEPSELAVHQSNQAGASFEVERMSARRAQCTACGAEDR